jgi:3-phenylpropionate/cinnamic acid dioxygenase small subunit
MKTLLRPILLCVLAFGVLAQAAADEADILRQAQDRAEIEDLMWRYVRALDSFDPDAYANVYTEDGQFGSGANATKGRAALRSMVENLRSGREERRAAGETVAPLQHVIANSKLEFVNEDEARFHSYWMTLGGSTGPGTTPNVLAAGRGVDHLVRVDGRWLIKSRDVAPEN